MPCGRSALLIDSRLSRKGCCVPASVGYSAPLQVNHTSVLCDCQAGTVALIDVRERVAGSSEPVDSELAVCYFSLYHNNSRHSSASWHSVHRALPGRPQPFNVATNWLYYGYHPCHGMHAYAILAACATATCATAT